MTDIKITLATIEEGNEAPAPVPAAPIEEKKHKKTFKEYYADPAFKARHLARMKEKVICMACRCQVKRCNMGHHKQTQKHKKACERTEQDLNKIGKTELMELIEKLQKMVDA